VLVVLAGLSAVGGFIDVPHYLGPALPAAPVMPEVAMTHTDVLVVSIVLALGGLAAAAWLFGRGALRADALRRRFGGLHRLLSGKYFVDEAYDALLGRPLRWISEFVFLRLSDRWLLDGSLNGLARIARATAGALGRVQSGALQLYAWLAFAGLAVMLVWTLRNV
jgi:NADH-quinone oxidoreductase subunit L